MITTVTGKNLVSIPVKVVRSLGIEPGTKLEWEQTADPTVMSVKIHPTRGVLARRLQGVLAPYVSAKNDLVEALDAERVNEDGKRNKQLQ